jgi:glycosyltransferase involved in cell wall biosynthesis
LNESEIVHVHNFAGDVSVLASFIRKFMRKNYRLIATDHNWNGLTVARLFKTSKPMMKFSGFDGLLPVTRAASSSYENFAKVFKPLYGGVDPERFRPVNGTRGKSILFVGRLTPYKKVENIIKAISLLKVKPELIVIGPTLDNQYRTLLESLASELAVVTRFLGPVSDESLVEYLSTSAALVLPSIDEGFGLVLLEAMACELPVVANRAGGVPEAVDDGKTGFLVRQGDIKELSDRVQLLLTDESEAIRIGGAGRRMVLEKFTWKHVAERSIQAYEEILQ